MSYILSLVAVAWGDDAWRLIFFVNVFYTLLAGKKAADNPWGEGATTLEWTLSSPPPFHQYETLPVIDDKGHH